jgi:norsolorinic acid ketoreductase
VASNFLLTQRVHCCADKPQGIGKTILQAYLGRPNHIVIGSVRDKTSARAQELQGLPVAAGTRLLLVKIESTAAGDPAEAVKEIEAAGVDHLDVVIANAGGLREVIAPLESVTADDVTETFQVNAPGPLLLFQAVRPLLQKSTATPKWISVSSALGSIGFMPNYHSHYAPAYGISKAALNWITMAAHCGNSWLVAFCVNPG